MAGRRAGTLNVWPEYTARAVDGELCYGPAQREANPTITNAPMIAAHAIARTACAKSLRRTKDSRPSTLDFGGARCFVARSALLAIEGLRGPVRTLPNPVEAKGSR